MKINILLGSTEARNGYLNIHPNGFAGKEDDEHVSGEPHKLDDFVDNSEAEEIIALDVLDYFPGRLADQVLDHWLGKIAHGGKLTLDFVDVVDVARAITNRSISMEEANILLYGNQNESYLFRKSAFTVTQIASVLFNKGYKIITKRIVNFRGLVIAERP